MVWHNHDSQTARAHQLASVVPQLDSPHMQPTSLVNQLRLAMNMARRHPTEVVRVDLNAHCALPLISHQHVRAHRPQSLRQHHTGTAMQQAVGLMRPGVHRHPTRHAIGVNFQHLDPQSICNGRPLADFD